MPARRKVQKALKEIKSSPQKDISVSLPDDKDCMKWHVLMIGPEDTPYYKGNYLMELNFTNNFPMRPPSTRMKTKIYHLNVDKAGKICLGLLDDEWTPKSKVTEILEHVYNLFSDPMPDSALNDDLCVQFVEDREAYDKKAAEWNKQFAMPPDANENNDDEKEKELQKNKGQNNNNNNDQKINDNVNNKSNPKQVSDDEKEKELQKNKAQNNNNNNTNNNNNQENSGTVNDKNNANNNNNIGGTNKSDKQNDDRKQKDQ